jgi:predicted amidophosphoribosyltransferase
LNLLDLLLPERCAGCGREGAGFCAGCLGQLVRLREPLCARCGAPVAWPVARCRECAGRRLAFARARAAVAYEGVAVRFVGAWKQGGRRSFAETAAAVVCEALIPPNAAALVFVPAAPGRELWRGHNPAERLAAELSSAWQLPLRPLLARVRNPRPQRGLLLAERRRNVAGAFRAVGRAAATVVLVDDVYTSGATATAAASALRQAGARSVEVVTFARALRDRASGPRR